MEFTKMTSVRDTKVPYGGKVTKKRRALEKEAEPPIPPPTPKEQSTWETPKCGAGVQLEDGTVKL